MAKDGTGKPVRPQSGVSKKKKKAGSGTSYKMPAFNRAFDNNDDIGDIFAQDELLGGDQGAPPDDEFAQNDLLEGD